MTLEDLLKVEPQEIYFSPAGTLFRRLFGVPNSEGFFTVEHLTEKWTWLVHEDDFKRWIKAKVTNEIESRPATN